MSNRNRERKIPVDWIKHLKDKEEQDQFTQQVVSSAEVLLVLKNLCNTRLEKSQNSTEADYDVPSWSHKQADAIGYQRALKELINILP